MIIALILNMRPLPRRYHGFTLVEILCVISIVALLAAILTPSFLAAQRRGQSTTCLSNLRQQSAALQSYLQDYEGSYPPVVTVSFTGGTAPANGSAWFLLLRPYTHNHLFKCPSRQVSHTLAQTAASFGYAMNLYLNNEQNDSNVTDYFGSHESAVRLPASTVTIFDVRAGVIGLDAPDLSHPTELLGIYDSASEQELRKTSGGATRHQGGANYAFVDGHAKWLRPNALIRKCSSDTPCFRP